MFGVPALRSEDPRFLRGEGRYLENIPIPDALRAVFVRSIMPHGRVNGIEGLQEARSMPGVAAVFTADDLRIPPQAPSGNVEGSSGTLEGPFAREVLARDVVRYVGEPVAVVIADSLARAQDAAELAWPVVEALDAVTDVEAAAADGAPMLFPPMGRTSRTPSSRTGIQMLWRAQTSSRARGSCSSASPRCPWRRTRSPWCPRTTAGTRSGSRRRCRSTCAAISRSCWRSTRSGSGSWRPTLAAASARSSSSTRSSRSWRPRRRHWGVPSGGRRRARKAC